MKIKTHVKAGGIAHLITFGNFGDLLPFPT